jgi:hypothetical protein
MVFVFVYIYKREGGGGGGEREMLQKGGVRERSREKKRRRIPARSCQSQGGQGSFAAFLISGCAPAAPTRREKDRLCVCVVVYVGVRVGGLSLTFV